MLPAEDRVAMVSGANRGIGRATVEHLLALGFRVSAGVRDVASLPARPGLFVFSYEAQAPESAEIWVGATMAEFGRIDAIVNAAGMNTHGTLFDADETAFDSLFIVNAKAPMRIIRAAWPHLAVSGAGRIVNLSSLSGKRVKNDNLAYAMSKFAMMALTQEVRRAGWDLGIRATTLCPGFVDTDMTRHVTAWPRERMTQPEDLAELIGTVLRLPNTASVAELLVNCRHEDLL
jgi:NAD(P)-dependent dehydrogenase (short-subunit alcohol dehydrogenase family)